MTFNSQSKGLAGVTNDALSSQYQPNTNSLLYQKMSVDPNVLGMFPQGMPNGQAQFKAETQTPFSFDLLNNGGLATQNQTPPLTFDEMMKLSTANQPSALTTGFKNFGLAAQGVGSLYGMYNAGKSRKLAEKQMGLTLADSNRSLANNTLSYNQDLMERTRNGLIANSVKEGSPEWNRRIAQANASKVDGSPIV